MVKVVLAIIAAALAAIPIAWQWSKARAQKKAVKDLEKRKQEIRRAVTTGNLDAVKRAVAKWL